MIQVKLISSTVVFEEQNFIKPLQLSSGLITKITEAQAEVIVEVNGKTGTGRGSIYLSDLWAWPDATKTHEEKDAILRAYCLRLAGQLPPLCGGEPAHPLELGLRLHHAVEKETGNADLPPLLARAMAASPFDAAIHDAAGDLLGRSAFELYQDETPIPSADSYFPGGAAKTIHKHLSLGNLAKKLPAWWIVGARDILEKDLTQVLERGYFSFKLKILGKDPEADATRTAEVFQFAKKHSSKKIRLCVDSNEANPDVKSVLEYLKALKGIDAGAYTALEYLEQPTGRDIEKYPFQWDEVTWQKPVLLDEGLTRMDLLQTSLDQGWSGFALKTCKGHSFALVAGIWALERGKLISLQDLTNPGLAAIHAALFASRLPTINGVELNSPQYTPAANQNWLPRLSGLFEPQDGFHTLNVPLPTGLGSRI